MTNSEIDPGSEKSEAEIPHKRRPRYKGRHPRRFEEKYKELNREKYPEEVKRIIASGRTPAGSHRPVCVQEVLKALKPKKGETGLDATLGYGGHATELLKKILPGGCLWATDVDPIEIKRTEARLRAQGFTEKELVVRRTNFAALPKLVAETGEAFDFILADLGVSSMQLDDPARGFTYKTEGELDLRMNPEKGQPAHHVLIGLSEAELETMLRENADEPYARAISRAVYEKRYDISTTTGLAEAVRKALPPVSESYTEDDINRSIRRTFQALRILVNDEFATLEQFLRNLPYCLKPGGRAAVLTFHSGEDNRVMRSFQAGLEAGLYKKISEKPVRPSQQEIYDNPRAKSAILRSAQVV